MDTRRQILDVVEQMLAAGDRLSIHAVAKRCGVSHSLIYNRYPDIKERIKELKQSQTIARKAAEDKELISKLLARNKTLRRRSQMVDGNSGGAALEALLVHIQQLYSMYDELLEDRNRLAARFAANRGGSTGNNP
ncbi:TetR/AcrR family transcriptional regulator [Burkholderia ubonensis]|uniref:TetR/AcrR family transcriptional regulator n=1 Tax=Burkholderia ubonensis TaxID=101571 RepID=UPI00075E5FED|nr:TetR/AcrR family transcriptional regulator [Burkholderia ubonensis]KVC71726.1 hypothetical protein WI75_25410 [Burkholderia ubonensis]